MSEGWQRDKAWSDNFLPEIKSILGRHLIGEAPEVEDQQRNTDLIVLRMEAVRIGCRVRSFDYWLRYPDEFTVRAGRPSGVDTELAKIVSGWGDYFFYGFADRQSQSLHAWTLGSLHVFRLWHSRQLARGLRPWATQNNVDGSSSFCAFRVNLLPADFVVARHSPNMSEAA